MHQCHPYSTWETWCRDRSHLTCWTLWRRTGKIFSRLRRVCSQLELCLIPETPPHPYMGDVTLPVIRPTGRQGGGGVARTHIRGGILRPFVCRHIANASVKNANPNLRFHTCSQELVLERVHCYYWLFWARTSYISDLSFCDCCPMCA